MHGSRHETTGPVLAEAAPFQFDAWRSVKPGEKPKRDTAGEYIPLAVLSDGTLAVITTIQNPGTTRFGFTFRAAPGRRPTLLATVPSNQQPR